jgi:hypothetical protein
MECETTNDLFAFLMTELNQVVGAIHPKDIPVFLMTPEEIDLWMAALAEEALKLRRPLADDALYDRCQRREEGRGRNGSLRLIRALCRYRSFRRRRHPCRRGTTGRVVLIEAPAKRALMPSNCLH